MAKESEQNEAPDLMEVISKFRKETYDQIIEAYKLQHLPLTPRERISRYVSTGEGVKETDLRQFGNSADDVGFVFTVPEYMRFAELGTVGGLSSADVHRSKRYNPAMRYVKSWNPITGDTHRPTFSPQLRNLSRRLGDFLSDFYGKQISARMFDAMGGNVDEQIELGF